MGLGVKLDTAGIGITDMDAVGLDSNAAAGTEGRASGGVLSSLLEGKELQLQQMEEQLQEELNLPVGEAEGEGEGGTAPQPALGQTPLPQDMAAEGEAGAMTEVTAPAAELESAAEVTTEAASELAGVGEAGGEEGEASVPAAEPESAAAGEPPPQEVQEASVQPPPRTPGELPP